MEEFRRRLLDAFNWRKSSKSCFNGNCVEVARVWGGLIGVRDTKDRESGTVLVFGDDSWNDFINTIKRDDLDLAS
jgi:hypothetical protein